MRTVHDIINTDSYPLHNVEASEYCDLIQHCRKELDNDGCCVVRSFIRYDVVDEMRNEASGISNQAHRSEEWHNPYFSEPQGDLGDNHPINFMQKRNNGFVPFDRIKTDGALFEFYNLLEISRFVMDAFSKDSLYKYADPLAAMPINVMRPGDVFPWHFDTNEFTLTLMLQEAVDGGLFEYAPNLRSPDDECYPQVQRILHGDRSGVKTLKLEPGDIQLFKGRFALHHVTEVRGSKMRLIAIPSWAAQPGMMGRPHRTKYLYGRLTDAHLSNTAQSRHDALAD